MGYRPKIRAPRASGHGKGASRTERREAKRHKSRYPRGSSVEESPVATVEDVVKKTLKQLRTLGGQRFAPSPYHEHFDRWLISLTSVLLDFESSPNMNADDQFITERSQILSNVESKLKEKRLREVSLEETIEKLSNSKNLLEQIKEEYVAKAREVEKQKRREIKRLQRDIDALKAELDSIARMKTGLLRGISRKDRDLKEAETSLELSNKQKDLELAMLNFADIRGKLRDEYETKMEPVVAQMRDREKKIETMETDSSLEDRWFACEALADSLNSFVQRKTLRERDQAWFNPSN